MTRKINLRPTYNQLHDACQLLADQVNRDADIFVPDYIVGLTRGGLPIAVMLSHMMNDIPVMPINYSSTKGRGDDKNHTNKLPPILKDDGKEVTAPNLLIVDDICDSGYTLMEVVHHYAQVGHRLRAMAVYYKIHDKPPIRPDYYWTEIPEDAKWVLFPWEKY